MKKLFILMTLLFVMPVFGTVSDNETIRESFACNGVTTTFTFTFKCNSSDDVLVYSPLTSTGQSTTALTVDVDYTIAPTGGSYLNGGVVTITPALASTFTVKIVRRIKLSQETSQGAITPTSIVAALDKITRQLQDAEDRKNRSLHLPDSDDISLDMTLPPTEERLGAFLGFDDTTGEPVALTGTIPEGSTSVFGGIFVQTANAASARGLLELDTDDPVEFAAGTFSGLITANGGVTLGAGDDLIGSATSDITINADKFTVGGVTGNTAVGGTLDVDGNIDPTSYETTNGGFLDEDDMASDSAIAVASQQSIKQYVDDSDKKPINGTPTQVFTKYFTGNLDADATTNVAHGIGDILDILSVSASAFNDSNSQVTVLEILRAESADNGFSVSYDGTNVIFSAVGANIQGNTYSVRIDYK